MLNGHSEFSWVRSSVFAVIIATLLFTTGCSSVTIEQMYVTKNLGPGCKSTQISDSALRGQGDGEADVATRAARGGAAGELIRVMQSNDECDKETPNAGNQ